VPNNDFPEAIHHSESAGKTYLAENVDDWFKRCMDDYPRTKKYPLSDTVNDRSAWVYKWFNQFRSDS